MSLSKFISACEQRAGRELDADLLYKFWKQGRTVAESTRLALQRGSISLPLLTFQACAAIGLASALWSVYLRLVAQIGGLGL